MDTTNTVTLVVLAVIVLIIAGVLGMALVRFQRTRRLRDRFGPEYDNALKRIGDKRQAEEELEARLDHVKNLNIHPLTAEEVNSFALEWQAIQAQFVDEPLPAIQKANQMIRKVMATRGYPVQDFEQRAADISVDYPDLVTNYRELHTIATKGEHEKISTEEMRQAMVRGRDLFESLIQTEASTEDANQKETV